MFSFTPIIWGVDGWFYAYATAPDNYYTKPAIIHWGITEPEISLSTLKRFHITPDNGSLEVADSLTYNGTTVQWYSTTRTVLNSINYTYYYYCIG